MAEIFVVALVVLGSTPMLVYLFLPLVSFGGRGKAELEKENFQINKERLAWRSLAHAYAKQIEQHKAEYAQLKRNCERNLKPGMVTFDLTEGTLLKLLKLVHPDRHGGNSQDALVLTQKLLELRDTIKKQKN